MYKKNYEDSNDPYAVLATAVIKQACNDYYKACKIEAKRRKKDGGLLTKRNIYKMKHKNLYGQKHEPIWMQECKNFLLSERAMIFTNIDCAGLEREIRRKAGITW